MKSRYLYLFRAPWFVQTSSKHQLCFYLCCSFLLPFCYTVLASGVLNPVGPLKSCWNFAVDFMKQVNMATLFSAFFDAVKFSMHMRVVIMGRDVYTKLLQPMP